MGSRFGGIPVEESSTGASRFGGIPVEDSATELPTPPGKATRPVPNDLQGPDNGGFVKSFLAAQPIHPIDAWNSLQAPNMSAVIDALPSTAHAASVGTNQTPEELAQSVKNIPRAPLGGDVAQPFTQALSQAQGGDLSGAAGTLVGGVGVPFLAGKAISKTPGVVKSTVTKFPSTASKVTRAAIKTFVPGGKTAIKAYDFFNSLKQGEGATPGLTPPPSASSSVASETPVIRAPLPTNQPATPAAPAQGLTPGTLDAIAQWKTGKNFNQLTPEEVKVVTDLAAKVKPQPPTAPTTAPATPATLPPPPGTPVKGLQSGQMAVKQHQVLSNVDQAIENKVANIHDYLSKNGIRAETLDAMTPQQLNDLAKAAHEHGQKVGNAVPKSGYKGLEGDSLQMVKDRLRQSQSQQLAPPPATSLPSPPQIAPQ